MQSSLRPHVPQREQEAIRDADCPEIEIALGVELAPVTGNSFETVVQEVVQPEIGLASVYIGEPVLSVLLALVVPDAAVEELLGAAHDFGTAHCLLPGVNLAEPVGTFNPVSAALNRAGIFRAQIEGNSWRLPAEVKSESVLAIVLQRLLPRAAHFQPGIGKEEADAAANMALRFQAGCFDGSCGKVKRVIHVGCAVDWESAAQHGAV